MPPSIRLGLALLAAGMLAGCAARQPRRDLLGALPPPVVVAGESEGVDGPDVSSLGTLADLRRRLPPRSLESAARDLLPEETRSLSAANSKLANLFDLERQPLARAAGCGKKAGKVAGLEQRLLCLRGIHERNQAAAQGLEAFYKLAEVRRNAASLAGSLSMLERMQDDLRKAQDEGLKVTADQSSLARKRLELLDQRAQLDLADAQLSEQLRGLIGMQPGEPTRLEPQPDLKVTLEVIDADAAVSIGLAARADLAGLRLLIGELDARTLPAARRGLSQADPALGISALALGALHKLLHVDTAPSELQIRCAQLAELLESRELQAASEIRLAVFTIEARLMQVAIAGEMLTSWQSRLGDLKALREVGSATPLEIQQAELEVAAAESALLKQAIAWRLAQVKLKEAQGLLAPECGYDTSSCLCP